MKLQEILENADIEKTISAIIKTYPTESDNIDKYREVIDTLKNMNHVHSDFKILIKKKSEDGYEYYNVTGVDLEGNAIYAMDMTPWAEWLSMKIDERTDISDNNEILAACLYEMTFCGFNIDDAEKVADELCNIFGKMKND